MTRKGVPAWGAILAFLLVLTGTQAPAQTVRVKDIARIGGMGEASFTALGLVVGLPGTGETRPPPGMALPPGAQLGRNSAVVMVTARLSPGLRAGSRVDVSVAAMGDARSLAGGILTPTALEGGDRQIYAIAEGPISAGGFWAGGIAASITQGSPATGSIAGGGMIERDVPLALGPGGQIQILLNRPDFTTARRVADAINATLGRRLARPLDNAAVAVTVPPDFPDGPANLIATIESAPLTPDRAAQAVVVDPRTGTVVAGLGIPLAPVAIGHGALTVRVTETPQVSQPAPFSSGGRTVVVPRSEIEISQNGRVLATPRGGTVGDLLAALDAAGVPVLDRIAILQAVRAAGGFEADLIAR